MYRSERLSRKTGFFRRALLAWLAGSLLTGTVMLAIFGFYLRADGLALPVLYLLLVWLLFPIGGALLFGIVHFGAPGDDDPG